MTPKQLGILNALVTFAAEHIPGGLSEDEQEVARIVGQATMQVPTVTHHYKVINPTSIPGHSMENAANHWAQMGWRVVGVISDTRPGYTHALLLERPVGVGHPDDEYEAPPDKVRQIHPDYQLIFVGVTEDNEKIALYKANKHPEELYIRRQNGELWALDPDATTSRHVDVHDRIHIRIYSSQWTGHAVGTMKDLREEQER